MKNLFVVFLLLGTSLLLAQTKEDNKEQKTVPLNLSLFTNSNQMPFSGTYLLTSAPIHPGINLGTERAWNKSKKNKVYQTLNLGYFTHRFSQHAIQLYTEIAYKRMLRPNFGLAVMAGGGYLRSIADFGIYALDDQGVYSRTKRFGRSQFMGGFALEAEYKPTCFFPIFFRYHFWLQGPFVDNYVPILPSTAIHLGIRLQLSKK